MAGAHNPSTYETEVEKSELQGSLGYKVKFPAWAT